MKKFYIFLSILITLGFFLPFIDKYSLFQIHDLIKNNSFITIDTSKILKSVLIFIISSWFISFGYSKKVKISILGLIGAIVYLYYYYNIFGAVFDSKDTIQKGFEYGNMFIGKENTIDIIVKIIAESGKHLGIGFYLILGGFILNSFAIINIFKNLILLSSGNYKPKEKIKENNINQTYINKIEISDEEKIYLREQEKDLELQRQEQEKEAIKREQEFNEKIEKFKNKIKTFCGKFKDENFKKRIIKFIFLVVSILGISLSVYNYFSIIYISTGKNIIQTIFYFYLIIFLIINIILAIFIINIYIKMKDLLGKFSVFTLILLGIIFIIPIIPMYLNYYSGNIYIFYGLLNLIGFIGLSKIKY